MVESNKFIPIEAPGGLVYTPPSVSISESAAPSFGQLVTGGEEAYYEGWTNATGAGAAAYESLSKLRFKLKEKKKKDGTENRKLRNDPNLQAQRENQRTRNKAEQTIVDEENIQPSKDEQDLAFNNSIQNFNANFVAPPTPKSESIQDAGIDELRSIDTSGTRAANEEMERRFREGLITEEEWDDWSYNRPPLSEEADTRAVLFEPDKGITDAPTTIPSIGAMDPDKTPALRTHVTGRMTPEEREDARYAARVAANDWSYGDINSPWNAKKAGYADFTLGSQQEPINPKGVDYYIKDGQRIESAVPVFSEPKRGYYVMDPDNKIYNPEKPGRVYRNPFWETSNPISAKLERDRFLELTKAEEGLKTMPEATADTKKSMIEDLSSILGRLDSKRYYKYYDQMIRSSKNLNEYSEAELENMLDQAEADFEIQMEDEEDTAQANYESAIESFNVIFNHVDDGDIPVHEAHERLKEYLQNIIARNPYIISKELKTTLLTRDTQDYPHSEMIGWERIGKAWREVFNTLKRRNK